MRSDTTVPVDRDLRAIWADTCRRIAAVLDCSPEGTVEARAVPGATIGAVVGHLVAAIEDVATGRPIDVGDLAAIVARAPVEDPSASFATCLRRCGTAVEGRVCADPVIASMLITEAVMCEHDLRMALDEPGARDSDAVKVALDELSGRLSDRVADAGLPPLRVTVEQWGTIVGDGRATSCVVADRFEFVRAMSGRRSGAEIARWNWGVDPTRYLPVIAHADLPAGEIHERDPRVPEHMRDREFVL